MMDEINVNETQFYLCICNFVKIEGCDFSYQAPILSYQHIKANLINVQEISPVPIGINLALATNC